MPEIARHCFDFRPEGNGGEAVLLCTILHQEEGDDDYWSEQELILNCYGQQASISTDVFTPSKLRKLANELDKFYAEKRVS